MFNTVILVVNAVDALLPSHNLQHKGSRGKYGFGTNFLPRTIICSGLTDGLYNHM